MNTYHGMLGNIVENRFLALFCLLGRKCLKVLKQCCLSNWRGRNEKDLIIFPEELAELEWNFSRYEYLVLLRYVYGS